MSKNNSGLRCRELVRFSFDHLKAAIFLLEEL